MPRRIHRLSIPFATALFLAAASAALAQEGPTFELFGARVESTNPDAEGHTESYGVRGGYRFSNRWALEAAVSRLDEDVDVWFGDLSAKVYAFQSDRFGIYALGGPGVYKFEDVVEELSLHLGVGAEISLGQRAYLRPEVRGNWLPEELKRDEGIIHYSLGLGWRF